MTTHVAGIGLKLGHIAVQRCMICGEALIADDLSKQMIPEGQEPGPHFWQTGAMVEVENSGDCTRTSKVGDLPEQFEMEDLPKTICTDLVEVS